MVGGWWSESLAVVFCAIRGVQGMQGLVTGWSGVSRFVMGVMDGSLTSSCYLSLGEHDGWVGCREGWVVPGSGW